MKSALRFTGLPSFLAVGALFASAVSMQAQFQGPPVTTPVPAQLTGPPLPGTAATSTPIDLAGESPILTVNPGDTLEISVAGITGLSTPTHNQLDAQGNVSLPYVGTLHVAGMSLPAIQSLIAQKYREGDFILNAQVTVGVFSAPSQVIAVTGEVRSPALVPSPGQRHLLDVLAAVGGLTPQASHLITVNRKSTGQSFQVLLDANPLDIAQINIPIFPGDTVIVPRAGAVYVIGSVKLSNTIPLVTNTPLTVTQAISIAGGANFEAALSQVRIIRTEGAERKAILLDLKRILDGKEADPILQADDIVYVPANLFKGALKGGGISVASSSIVGFAYLLK